MLVHSSTPGIGRSSPDAELVFWAGMVETELEAMTVASNSSGIASNR
jgi:hypothetical protein